MPSNEYINDNNSGGNNLLQDLIRQSEGSLTKPDLKDQTVKMSPSSVACLFMLGGALMTGGILGIPVILW